MSGLLHLIKKSKNLLTFGYILGIIKYKLENFMINPIYEEKYQYMLKYYPKKRKVEEVAKSKKNDNKFAPKDTYEPSKKSK